MHLGIIQESKLRFEKQQTMVANKIIRLLDTINKNNLLPRCNH